MKTTLQALGTILLCAAGLVSVAAEATAQEATNICLRSGTRIRAARIETQDGKYLFYPAGSAAAISEDAANVRCIGCNDCGGQPVKFAIAGSNTIGEALLPAIIRAYSKKAHGVDPVFEPVPGQHEAQTIKIGSSEEPLATIDFTARGSGTAPKPLLERKIQIGMMSRRMKPAEVAEFQAALNIDPTEPANEHVVALDGVAVILHPDNPIKTMALSQIAAIFSGEVTNWRDVQGRNAKGEKVSGPDLPIKVHARSDKSGTFDTFKSLVLEPFKKSVSPQAVRYENSDELSAAVSNPKDLGGIGFIGFAYINKGKPVHIQSGCGISSKPDPYLVKLEAYPLARRLYLYTVGEPAEPVAKGILQYALSDEAQSIAVNNGFIDKSVGYENAADQNDWISLLVERPTYGLAEDKNVPSTATRELARRTKGYQRSSVVFRFETNKSELDSLASEQVGRLARYLKKGNAAKRVLLVGFADSVGPWDVNHALAQARVQTVAQKLADHGLQIGKDQLISMSYAAPIACNDEEALGRQLNRRVEVWIAK